MTEPEHSPNSADCYGVCRHNARTSAGLVDGRHVPRVGARDEQRRAHRAAGAPLALHRAPAVDLHEGAAREPLERHCRQRRRQRQ